MSKNKKDLRNGRESGRWHPAKWNEKRGDTFTRDTYKHAALYLAELLDPHEGRIVAAKLISLRDENASVELLHKAGYKTIGETQ